MNGNTDIKQADISKEDFKIRLRKIGYTYERFSKMTGIGLSTIKNWREIPMYTQFILEKLEYESKVNKLFEGIEAFKELQNYKSTK